MWQAASAPPAEPGGYGLFLFETLVILALVCVAAWAFIRFGVRRLHPTGGGRRGPLRLVARLPLEPRRTLFIVEAAGKTFLVGASEHGPLTSLAELDPAEVAAAVAAGAPARVPMPSFLEFLRRKIPPATSKGE